MGKASDLNVPNITKRQDKWQNPGKITKIRALSGQFSTNARISDLFGRLKFTDTRSVQKDKYPGIMHHQIAYCIQLLPSICYRAVDLSSLKFKVTGDLHFLMPLFGLMGCGSSNPCLYCPLERRKVGGKAAWEARQVELRTVGSLESGCFYFSDKVRFYG